MRHRFAPMLLVCLWVAGTTAAGTGAADALTPGSEALAQSFEVDSPGSPARQRTPAWFRILATAEDGTRRKVGFSYRSVANTPSSPDADRQEVLVYRSDTELLTKSSGLRTAKIFISTTYRENQRTRQALGATREITIGRNSTRTEARALGDTLRVTITSRAGEQTRDYAFAPGTRLDAGLGLLPLLDQHDQVAFDHFDLSSLALQQHEITRMPVGHGAKSQLASHVLRTRISQSERLLSETSTTVDDNYQLLVGHATLSGLALHFERTDEARAMQKNVPFDTFSQQAIKSPYMIPTAALAGHMRYRFSAKNPGVKLSFPSTTEQRVTPADDGSVVLDICTSCGNALSDRLAASAHVLALAPTRWLESDAKAVQRLVRRVANNKRWTDAKKMEQLVQVAQRQIRTIEFAGHRSAVETIKTKRGDCTESAVLLAALGRAAGIPTRVANGLVYSRARYHGVRNVFIPHAWVIAFVDGRWRSFDAALDDFDASHIALVIGDGGPGDFVAARTLAVNLNWDAQAQVRKRGDASD